MSFIRRHNIKFWFQRLIQLTGIQHPANISVFSSKWHRGLQLQEPRTLARQVPLWTRQYNHSHYPQRKMASKGFRNTLWKTIKSLFSLDQQELCSWGKICSFSTEPKLQQSFLWPHTTAFTFLNSSGPQVYQSSFLFNTAAKNLK